MNTQDTLEEWCLYLSDEKDRTPKTVETYLATISLLLRRAGKHPSEISAEDCAAFRRAAPSRNTRRVRVNAMKCFFRWFSPDTDPTSQLICPPLQRRPPRDLACEDVMRMDEKAVWEGIETLVLYRLCLYQGLRISEACNLRWEHVSDGWLTIHGKGAQTRRIPLHQKTLRALESLQNDSSGPWVLPRPSDRLQPLSASTARKRLKALAKRAHLDPKEVHPHRLRHTFATSLLASGVDVAYVQRFLGHSSIQTTMIYTNVRPAGMEKEIQKLRFK